VQTPPWIYSIAHYLDQICSPLFHSTRNKTQSKI
jgi:hypothetical protein